MFKVLIIDDEKPVRQAITALGHWTELEIGQLYEAMEGERGLAILREYHPDIVLVDMKMPNLDGAGFLEIASHQFPRLKYIVISGYDDFEYTKRAIKAKVLDYLLKPVV
jgi:two-component system response regulator YesN